jgi:hypothetical protein
MWQLKQVNITLILLSSIGIIPKKGHSSTKILWAIIDHSVQASVFYTELIQHTMQAQLMHICQISIAFTFIFMYMYYCKALFSTCLQWIVIMV